MNANKLAGAALAGFLIVAPAANAQGPSLTQSYSHTADEEKAAAARAPAKPGDPVVDAAKKEGTDAATSAADGAANAKTGGLWGRVKNSGLGKAVSDKVDNAKADGSKGVEVLVHDDVAKAMKDGAQVVAVFFGTHAQAEELKVTDALKGSTATSSILLIVDANDVGGKKDKNVATAQTALSTSFEKSVPFLEIFKGTADKPAVVLGGLQINSEAINSAIGAPAAAPGAKPAEGGRREGTTPAKPKRGASLEHGSPGVEVG